MIYTSSLELIDNIDKTLNEKQIIISNDESKEIIFNNNLKKIEYLYPHINPKNDIVINFNLLDISRYSVTIFFNNYKSSDIDYIRNGNDLIYLDDYEWKDYCNENEICPIIIQIKLISTFVVQEPKLIISINTVQDSFPSYIQKNKFKIDFLLGNNFKYYYTDIGKFEEGEISINFRRGCGKILSKIIPKNLEKPEIGADWRESYKFPKIDDESMEFNGYINKIKFGRNETKFCEDGCYLLLSLQNSIISQEF